MTESIVIQFDQLLNLIELMTDRFVPLNSSPLGSHLEN
jgi:hypothetical protein